MLEREKYLLQGTARQRKVMVMIRGGSNNLRIETGRWERVPVEERVCIFCERGVVEDEYHFLCECEAWQEERLRVIKGVKDRMQGVLRVEEVMFLKGEARSRRREVTRG